MVIILLRLLVMLALIGGSVDLTLGQQEQLSQLVEQLQKAPNDNALREKIIKLAASMKPAPALPDVALTHEGRAQFAFKKAQSEADFVSAAEEYEKAVAAAPWVAGYYSDLCTIYEKASKYAEAKRNCGFYLVSLTDPNEITDLKRRIAGLDYGIEQNAAKKAEQDKIGRAEDEKRRAEQARRDVITTIKNIVNNRSYVGKQLSYCRESDCIWSGLNQNELFGGRTYYEFRWFDNIYWRFFDERVEVWGTNGDGSQRLQLLGESWGPKVTDMRWFLGKGDNTKSETQQVWTHFDLKNGYLYRSFYGTTRPLNESEFDPNKRYNYDLFRPAN